jgi:hypothetical protein
VDFVGQFLVRDPVIEDLMTRMALEVKNGSPLGQLSAESAAEFRTRHVIHSYSSLSTPQRMARSNTTLPVIQGLCQRVAEAACRVRTAVAIAQCPSTESTCMGGQRIACLALGDVRSGLGAYVSRAAGFGERQQHL